MVRTKAVPTKVQQINGHGVLADLSNLPKQNEILFVLDSVGWTEFNRANSPNIKSLKHVHKAYSHSYYTPPSMEAMFRGALPQPEGQCFWPYGRYSTAGENVLIPPTMANRGYNTYLLSSNLLISTERIKSGPDIISCHQGMFQHCYMNDMRINSAGPLVKWFLNHMKEPFFAVFLVIETHTPYLGRDKKQATQIQAIETVDKAFGNLVKGIHGKKMKFGTRVIVTSDHSEAWANNNTVNGGHNPRYYHRYLKDNKLKRLTEVFMARGHI